ncbi:SRPBCC family protein [Streptomyces malaysiensis]|uniref:hypothetical protein n=1 Tax=Streptomyces malaysiensis TaxID=92644 RepID=UPI001FE4E7D9|nr:hypothetical protein [Streptomyces solisilvae]
MNDTTYTNAELTELDRIARQIDIDAPAERVWELIARPGWYVNDGAVEADPDLCYEATWPWCAIRRWASSGSGQ